VNTLRRRDGRKAIVLALLAAALVVGLSTLTACGSSTDDEGVAALEGTESTTGSEGSSTEASTDPEQAALDFAECMRENGVPEFEDPVVNADGTLSFQGGAFGSVDREVLQQTMEECRPILEAAGFEAGGQQAGQDPELQDTLLEFAQCMRENGVPDFPDPDFTSGGGVLFGDARAQEDSPAFQAALEKCQPILAELGGPLGGVGTD
jgi:hypothetical protein